jgi:hypothetical protein
MLLLPSARHSMKVGSGFFFIMPAHEILLGLMLSKKLLHLIAE